METMLAKEAVCLRISRSDSRFQNVVNICRATKGSQFHTHTQFFSFPRKATRDQKGAGFYNEEDLIDYIMFELEKLQHKERNLFVEDPMPELTIDIPLKREMFHYQKQGVAYNLIHERVLIGDDMGLGKSIQALASVIAQNAFPCLIICKNGLMHNWMKEIQEWTNKRAFIFKNSIQHSWGTYFNVGEADIGIVNYDSLQKYFVTRIRKPEGEKLRLKHIEFKKEISLFKSIIIDESHMVKNPSVLRTKFCVGLCQGKRYVYLLSGTPVLNDAAELYPQLCMLGMESKFGTQADFKRQYSGKKNSANWKVLNARLKRFGYYHRMKKDVLKDLPEKMRHVVLCDIDNREEYDLAFNQFRTFLQERLKLSGGQIDIKMRAEALVQMGELKKLSAKGKMGTVLEWANDLTEQGEKYVLFTYHKNIAHQLADTLPKFVTMVDADRDAKQARKEKFMADPEIMGIGCSITADAEGHTLTAASHLGLVELPWHYGKADQIESRIHRIGQKNGAMINYFIGKDTIDEKIYDLIMSKKDLHDSVTGSEDDSQAKVVDSLIGLLAGRTVTGTNELPMAAPKPQQLFSEEF